MINNLLAVIISFSFIGCEKVDVPKGTPKCIKKEIRKQKDNCLEMVYKYQYNGETVYYFIPANCPDAGSVLYKDDCTYICSPAGGISGTGDGKCTDFFQNRTDEKLIWQY